VHGTITEEYFYTMCHQYVDRYMGKLGLPQGWGWGATWPISDSGITEASSPEPTG